MEGVVSVTVGAIVRSICGRAGVVMNNGLRAAAYSFPAYFSGCVWWNGEKGAVRSGTGTNPRQVECWCEDDWCWSICYWDCRDAMPVATGMTEPFLGYCCDSAVVVGC